MKKEFIAMALAACFGASSCSDKAAGPAIPSDQKIEKAIDKLLSKK